MASLNAIHRRVLETLQADPTLKGMVESQSGVFRLGRLPGRAETQNTLTLVYVTSPATPIHARQTLGGPPADGVSPAESVTYIVHVVAVTRPQGSPYGAQEAAYDFAEAIIGALSRNLVLHDAEGNDPLSQDITVNMVDRMEEKIGTDSEAIGVIAYITTIVEHMSRTP